MKPRDAYYFAAEGARGLRRRFLAWAKKKGRRPDRLRIAAETIDLTDGCARLAALLTAEREAGRNPRLVIVDTLASATPGADENGGKDMGSVIVGLCRVAQENGCAVVIVHHTGKSKGASGGRGWSGLDAAMDCIIEVSTPGPLQVALEITKVKDEAKPAAKVFNGEPVVLTPPREVTLKDGRKRTRRPITSLVFTFDPLAAPQPKEKAVDKHTMWMLKLPDLVRRVAAEVRKSDPSQPDNGCTFSMLAGSAHGYSDDTLRRKLEVGTVYEVGGHRIEVRGEMPDRGGRLVPWVFVSSLHANGGG